MTPGIQSSWEDDRSDNLDGVLTQNDTTTVICHNPPTVGDGYLTLESTADDIDSLSLHSGHSDAHLVAHSSSSNACIVSSKSNKMKR